MAVVVYKLNIIILLILVFTSIVSQALVEELDACSGPLGMENGNIKDSQITVSSAISAIKGNSGKYARLRKNIPNVGGWCPLIRKATQSRKVKYNDYIQIDLLNLTGITKVATQGREYSNGIEFPETYKISYYCEDNRIWMDYEENSEIKIFDGNTDVKAVVDSKLDPFIEARYIRIHPGKISGKHVCLRLELYGCPIAKYGITKYTMPRGIECGKLKDEHSNHNDTMTNMVVFNGIGLLTDGKIGPVNSNEDSGNEWIRWKKRSTGQDSVNITFSFWTFRKFNDVSLMININNKCENMLFYKSRIFFSQTADDFSDSSTLEYFPKQVQMKTLIGNMNVSIPLCGNVAKFVMMQLYLDGGPIALSEITFNSVPALIADRRVMFKTCSDTDNNISEPVESRLANLLYILIALVSLLCFIGLVVVIALLLKRRAVKQSTRNKEITLHQTRVPSLNNVNIAVPEAVSSSNQIQAENEQNQLNEEENQEDAGYEYLPVEHYDPSYTPLTSSRKDDENTYQKLQISSASLTTF